MEESLDGTAVGSPWSVERRFRVTEVFLAVLWVWISFFIRWISIGTRLGDEDEE